MKGGKLYTEIKKKKKTNPQRNQCLDEILKIWPQERRTENF